MGHSIFGAGHMAHPGINFRLVDFRLDEHLGEEMSGEYYLVHICDNCDTPIKKLCMWMSGDIPEICLQLLGQEDFECPECGEMWCYGDIEYLNRKDI